MTKIEAYDIALNANYNDKYIEYSIAKLKNTMFNECNSYVEYLCGIKTFSGKMSDFEITRYFNQEHDLHGKTYTVSIEFDFINFFRSYKFAKKHISNLNISDIDLDKEIYKYKALFFIDGYLMQDIVLVPKGNHTVIAIEPSKNDNALLNYSVITDLVKNKDADWTLILEPHSNFAYGSNLHPDVLFNNGKNLRTTIVNNNITTIKKESRDWKLFTSCNHYNNHFLVGTLATRQNNGVIALEDSYVDYIKDKSTNVSYWLFNESNLYKRLFKDPNEKIQFIIPEDSESELLEDVALPIPPNNVIVWKVYSNQVIKLIHRVEVNLDYPNIYTINIDEDLTDVESIMIDMYYTDTSELDFNNLVYEYMNWIGADDYFNRFISNTLPECITSYEPLDFVYNIPDFKNEFGNHYYATPIYKVNKVKEYMNEKIDVFRKYSARIEKFNFRDDVQNYVVDVSESPWIMARNEKGNTYQITNKQNIISEFDGRDYTYITISTTNLAVPQLALYIDGLRVVDFKCFNELYKIFLYIPKEYVKEDSMIEIEIFNKNRSYTYSNIPQEGANAISIKLKNLTTIKPMDIMVIDKDTSQYLPDSAYEIAIAEMKLAKYKFQSIDGTNDVLLLMDNSAVDEAAIEFEDISDEQMVLYLDDHFIFVDDGTGNATKYYKLSKNSPRPFDVDDIKVIITDPSYYGREITIANADLTSIKAKRYKGYKTLDISIQSFGGKPEEGRIRAFCNGVKLPIGNLLLHMDMPNYYKDTLTARFALDELIDNDIAMDYLPYSYTEIYHKNLIDANGIVKLNGYLDRPFDMRYYDVYLNGKKLNYKNIQIFSEDIIRIRNVQSRMNLRIFEKNFDDDIFNYKDSGYHSIFNRLLYEDEYFFDYIFELKLKESREEEGYELDTGIISDAEGDLENGPTQNVISDVSEEIQKDIIPFYPIAADDVIKLTRDHFNTVSFHFITGTNFYRVNPDQSLYRDNNEISERVIVSYDVDADRSNDE